MINSTLEYIIPVCNTLGYLNLSLDILRIVDDVMYTVLDFMALQVRFQ